VLERNSSSPRQYTTALEAVFLRLPRTGITDWSKPEMKDQHEKITGYRDLTQEEIDMMNEGKALAEQCGAFIAKLESIESTDKRSVALGKTSLQQGFMWAIRGVARPSTF
jgi:hypothetical protein